MPLTGNEYLEICGKIKSSTASIICEYIGNSDLINEIFHSEASKSDIEILSSILTEACNLLRSIEFMIDLKESTISAIKDFLVTNDSIIQQASEIVENKKGELNQ